MNTIKTILLLSFSILFFSCSDEEDKKTEKFIFSASELKQTEWKGDIFYLGNGEVDLKGTIKFVFYTESEGVCEYKLDYNIDPEIIVLNMRLVINLCILMGLFLFMEIGYYKNTMEIC